MQHFSTSRLSDCYSYRTAESLGVHIYIVDKRRSDWRSNSSDRDREGLHFLVTADRFPTWVDSYAKARIFSTNSLTPRPPCPKAHQLHHTSVISKHKYASAMSKTKSKATIPRESSWVPILQDAIITSRQILWCPCSSKTQRTNLCYLHKFCDKSFSMVVWIKKFRE